jgi:outer membrane lipoprotein-sorting protein
MNRALAAIFLAIVLSGCPKRIEFGPEGPIEDPEKLFELTSQAQANVLTLQGDAKLRVDSPQGSGTLSMFVAISRPGLLHLETFDFFNRPVAALVSDGQRFGLYQTEGHVFYQGPASPENVSRFLPVVLPSEELVAVMLGQVPFIPAERKTLELDRDKGVYVLKLFRGRVTQTLHVHTRLHRVVRSEVRGIPGYDLAFDDLKEQGKSGVVFPKEVKLIAEAAETELRLRYSDVTLNGPPDLTLFELTPPEGARVVEVDARGREIQPTPAVPAPSPPVQPGS